MSSSITSCEYLSFQLLNSSFKLFFLYRKLSLSHSISATLEKRADALADKLLSGLSDGGLSLKILQSLDLLGHRPIQS